MLPILRTYQEFYSTHWCRYLWVLYQVRNQQQSKLDFEESNKSAISYLIQLGSASFSYVLALLNCVTTSVSLVGDW